MMLKWWIWKSIPNDYPRQEATDSTAAQDEVGMRQECWPAFFSTDSTDISPQKNTLVNVYGKSEKSPSRTPESWNSANQHQSTVHFPAIFNRFLYVYQRALQLHPRPLRFCPACRLGCASKRSAITSRRRRRNWWVPLGFSGWWWLEHDFYFSIYIYI